ncbi:hypothetical protein GBA52_026665 [Prunus armeniaca]|nr:hypothetical protein GBA52_026665 [Prunus armeniaca]
MRDHISLNLARKEIFNHYPCWDQRVVAGISHYANYQRSNSKAPPSLNVKRIKLSLPATMPVLDTKNGGQAMVLLNWLFEDDFLFLAIATTWLKLFRPKMIALLPEIAGIMESTWQDAHELPSRLAISAADCFLALTEALTKEAKIPSNRPKLSASNAPKRQLTSVAIDSGDKKAKPTSESLVTSNMELEYILWDHLEELNCLGQKLLALQQESDHIHGQAPSSSSVTDPKVWKLVWSLEAPPNFFNFLWKALRNWLATKENMFMRKISSSHICPICCNELETMEHMLLLCTWVVLIWFGGQLNLRIDKFSISIFANWLLTTVGDLPCSPTDSCGTISIIAFTCWHIWKLRFKMALSKADPLRIQL